MQHDGQKLRGVGRVVMQQQIDQEKQAEEDAHGAKQTRLRRVVGTGIVQGMIESPVALRKRMCWMQAGRWALRQA